MPNRLANETSPYLLQHADNPVDWYAWGDEAFAAAKEAGKPVLLSVGYSACHWCHVMAHESFENTETAALMNQLFVSIKVDREERPDVDNIYMQAVQSMTGRGGWPMTVFLTDEGIPFYGGTYYPPEDRHGMPGFPKVLQAVSEAYKDKRQQLEIAGHDLLQRISSPAELKANEDNLLTESILDEAAGALLQAHDDDLGGFGKAPKFPQAMDLDFLLRYHHSSGKAEVLAAAEVTLKAMANGGMYDQVGGGFHRYSTDDVWLVPHFEKMLYDNALLARVYLDAYKVTGNAFYRRITQETLDYVLREMTDPSGGFYSTQDADSEGEEGKFFLWTPAQLEAVLGEDAELVGRYFGATEGGNFEGSNILNVPTPAHDFAPQRGLDVAQFEAKLLEARTRLYAAREQRIHPARDEKVLTAWNGLMQRAFAEAAIALDNERYREAAAHNADFLLTTMRPNGRQLRTWKPGLDARLNGYLEDYACLIDAPDRHPRRHLRASIPQERRRAGERDDRAVLGRRGAGLLRHRQGPRRPDHAAARLLRQRHALRHLGRRRRAPAPGRDHRQHGLRGARDDLPPHAHALPRPRTHRLRPPPQRPRVPPRPLAGTGRDCSISQSKHRPLRQRGGGRGRGRQRLGPPGTPAIGLYPEPAHGRRSRGRRR